jgi:hypothetical protein
MLRNNIICWAAAAYWQFYHITFYLDSPTADWPKLQNKTIGLSMYCKKGVTELSKSTNLVAASYTHADWRTFDNV